jgi:aryl-alcohol dehydrogenase-like predicted oxidoreductase
LLKRSFGHATPLEVSAIGFGCMGMTGGYSHRPDRDEMLASTRHAVELGVTFFDTAETYGPRANEELIGDALAPFRDDVVITTKYAQDFDPIERKARGRMLLHSEIARAVEGSLSRLRVDTIDLYYQHRVNPDVPIEEYANPVKELIEVGKVQRFGM